MKNWIRDHRDRIDPVEIVKFTIVGCVLVAVDSGAYYLLFRLGAGVSFAKGAAYVLGTIVSFLLNKFWTFRKTGITPGEPIRFAVLYGVSLLANVGVNRLCLLLFPGCYPVAYVAATGTSTVINFIGQKFWVFRV
ncbi:MAG TPA: GtrA family protein [Spirochaetota bacterium]|nr:GtrA family protein [Spirochaetota bacterium]HNT11679.1 GtrA family protein [Spirochaetota bacterium]